MDGYAYVLERLRADQCRRLREYTPDGHTKFTTWLVVVARRLCLDLLRHRYGRSDDPAPDAAAARAARRRLVNLVAGETEPEQLAALGADAASALQADELHRALDAVTAGLPAADRLLLKLRFDDDLSAREIAGLLDLPTPFHVYRRLNALLGELRRVLRKHGIDEAEP